MWERRHALPAVSEFRHHDLAALDGQRTRAITIVDGRRIHPDAAEIAQEIFRDDRRLLANRGRRLGVGGAHRIAETVDVGIALVAQRLLINLDPAGLVSEWARSDEVGRALGRNDVQHVELAFDDLAIPVLAGPLEPCRL